MNEIFEIIKDLTIPVGLVALGEYFVYLLGKLVILRLTSSAFNEMSSNVDKLDQCVKIISAELDEVADAIHDLNDHK